MLAHPLSLLKFLKELTNVIYNTQYLIDERKNLNLDGEIRKNIVINFYTEKPSQKYTPRFKLIHDQLLIFYY